MFKHKRHILFGAAILALVALAGLTVVAFAQGEAEPTASGPGHQLNMDQAFQGQAPGRMAKQFIQHRVRENLAQALGITPDELDQARWQAWLAALEEAVEEGYLAQKAADHMLAQALIRQSADRDTLIAAGLGISMAQLQDARDAGQTPRQLVDELGLDATTIGQNLATALEGIILRAAENGLISDQQADRILDDQLLDRLARGLWQPWRQGQRPDRPRDRF